MKDRSCTPVLSAGSCSGGAKSWAPPPPPPAPTHPCSARPPPSPPSPDSWATHATWATELGVGGGRRLSESQRIRRVRTWCARLNCYSYCSTSVYVVCTLFCVQCCGEGAALSGVVTNMLLTPDSVFVLPRHAVGKWHLGFWQWKSTPSFRGCVRCPVLPRTSTQVHTCRHSNPSGSRRTSVPFGEMHGIGLVPTPTGKWRMLARVRLVVSLFF